MPEPKGKMCFSDAAYEILITSRTPLKPTKISDKAIQKGLIITHSKRPGATMAARLWSDKRFISAGNGKWKLRE